MPDKPKITFSHGHFVAEQIDADGTVATFTGPGAGSAGKQYVDWLAHEPGTELEDLRVAVNEIDGALCNYLNQVGDSFEPVSQWDEFCKAGFRRLCDAYNEWHKNRRIVGELSQKFWGQFESELYYTKKKLRKAEQKIAQLEGRG